MNECCKETLEEVRKIITKLITEQGLDISSKDALEELAALEKKKGE